MKTPIKASFIVKLNFLFLGLGLVIYLMYLLNSHGLPRPLTQLFGGSDRLSWCDTRVQAIIRPDQFKLEQVDKHWLVENSTGHRQANFLAVEKWFVEYCKLPAKPLPKAGNAEQFRAALIVRFINGQIAVLKQGQNDLFSWRGQVLSSPGMSEALSALGQLASDTETSPLTEIPEESEP